MKAELNKTSPLKSKMNITGKTALSIYRMNRNPNSSIYEEQQRAASALNARGPESWIWKN